MISLNDISLKIGDKELLNAASVQIPLGHKVGIVGRNGSGKTTLFKLLAGEISPDQGEYNLPKGISIGQIKQEAPASTKSLTETVLEFDQERLEILQKIETETEPNELAELHSRLADIGAYSAEARASNILFGLGFSSNEQVRSVDSFSGGWRMRIALAGVLFSNPDILLLDEPSNYLDLEGLLWLQNYLASYPNTVLIISHDRALLNKSVGSILHLSQKNLKLYSGNYDSFDKLRREKQKHIEAQAKKQQSKRDHLQKFVDRFRAKATKAKQAQSRLKMLEKLQPISVQSDEALLQFSFPNPNPLNSPILKASQISLGYNDRPILKNITFRIDQDDRIALLGANGQGKSTFSKFLALELKQIEGQFEYSSKIKVGYFAQHQVESLRLNETPIEHLKHLRPEFTITETRTKLALGGITQDQADILVGQLSGGQKARLSLILATIDKPHLLILDEPTNHLDMESREALIFALNDYQGAVLLVSHDPHLIGAIADSLWLVKDGTISKFDGDLDAYETLLLQEKARPETSKPPKRADRTNEKKKLVTQRSELRRAEERVEKLEEMRRKIDTLLADQTLYQTENSAKIENLNRKRAEIVDALSLAEQLWLQAEEKLNNMSMKLEEN